MSNRTRIFDIEGQIINEPVEYHTALDAAKTMLDAMEKSNIDRSDMRSILLNLLREVEFHFMFNLPIRITTPQRTPEPNQEL
jgi:hypothetical protein